MCRFLNVCLRLSIKCQSIIWFSLVSLAQSLIVFAIFNICSALTAKTHKTFSSSLKGVSDGIFVIKIYRSFFSSRLLSSVSHVIMDEVHERNVASDFLTILVRDLLPKR